MCILDTETASFSSMVYKYFTFLAFFLPHWHQVSSRFLWQNEPFRGVAEGIPALRVLQETWLVLSLSSTFT